MDLRYPLGEASHFIEEAKDMQREEGTRSTVTQQIVESGPLTLSRVLVLLCHHHVCFSQ